MSKLLRGNRRHLLKGALASAGVVALGAQTRGSAGAQTVKLVNVEHDSRPLDNAAYEAVYEAFQEQHPDIEIEFQIIPWEQARSKMLTLAQANSLPDMGRMEWASDYAAADMLVSLDDMVDQETLSRFDKLASNTAPPSATTARRHLYALPWFQGAAAILVNKTLLDKAGLATKEEWTTDEFTEYAKALTVEGQQWGVALDGAGIGDPVQNLLLAVYAYGGRWVAGDASATEPEPIVFNSPETVAGITWYTKLFTDGYARAQRPDRHLQGARRQLPVRQGRHGVAGTLVAARDPGQLRERRLRAGLDAAAQGPVRQSELVRRRARLDLHGGRRAWGGRSGL